MSAKENPVPLTGVVRDAWHKFLEQCEPLRPELYRYCRHLTRSPWEADDLVQDTLMRSFVAMGCIHQEIHNPRAWLFRVASNLWLNRIRDAREVPTDSPLAGQSAEPSSTAGETRDAARTLIGRLAPQERAAIVLKEVFDLSLEEISGVLSTTVAAVKAALHRGRTKLAEDPPTHVPVAIPSTLDAFCAAFNARDLEGVTALLLENATFEFPGLALEVGVEVAKRGSLAGVLNGDPTGDGGGVAPELRRGMLPKSPRFELRVHRGEVLMLAWFSHDDGDAVRAIARFELEGDRIAHVRTYLHAPDVVAEICAELAVPFRSNGYRYWW